MGGGDSSGDFQGQQAAVEAQKQAARDRLNALFGVAPSAQVTAPTREQFTTPGSGGRYETVNQAEIGPTQLWVPDSAPGFDQAGFDAAQQAYDQQQGAAGNAAARDQLYQTVRDDTFAVGKRKLDEDKTKAQRALKFELFAKGLNGGSEDVNQNAMLGRTYDQGILDLGGKADAAKAQFRGDDENTRLGLLQSIDAGTDEGSAISSAINSMRVNSDRAAAAAQGTTLGDLFANAGLLYSTSQAAKGKQAGFDAFTALMNNRPKGATTNAGAGGMTTALPGE